MNKEVNFSRFVGIAVVIICIWIVVLALMSAIMKNENSDNLIYVDDGIDISLDIPKSNIISNHINTEEKVDIENGISEISARLPKINIDTNEVRNINNKINDIYENAYLNVSKATEVKRVEIDYTYEYVDNDSVLEITITTKTIINNKLEEKQDKFIYDLLKDKQIVE